MSKNSRKERERENRRMEIVEAAERLFFANGFEGTTMDEIAKQAEFSKMTLYAYFKSKEELYHVVFVKGFRTRWLLQEKEIDN